MLELKDVTFTYPASANGLGKVRYHFTARCGRVIELSGASGIGKSSLLSAIGGHMPIDGGQIIWHGQDLGPLGMDKRPTSLLFQDARNFPDASLRDNVALGINGSLRLTRAQLLTVDGLIDELGLSERAGFMAKTLSGGEGQRTAFARALLKIRRFKAGLLLLDEFTTGLDDESHKACYKLLRDELESNPQMGVVISGHQNLPQSLSKLLDSESRLRVAAKSSSKSDKGAEDGLLVGFV